jgi:hypothetical protein
MNFKLEKKIVAGISNFRYTFKVDDVFVEQFYFYDDETAIQWYNLYKSVYEPQKKEIIQKFNELELRSIFNVIVNDKLEVKNRYCYVIWMGMSILELDTTYNEQEHIDNLNEYLNKFETYKKDYENVLKKEISNQKDNILIEETI